MTLDSGEGEQMSNRVARLTDAAVGPELAKAPTGIAGFDQITGGGLPRDQLTLLSGGAGAGKTLLGLDASLACGARGSAVTSMVARQIDLFKARGITTLFEDREKHQAAETEADRLLMAARRWADVPSNGGQR